MTRRSDPNPAYWEQYGPFQQVKHELIRCYLNGWYPKLGTWARRVLYVDTHAGRGRYESGDPGSPVLALQTLLRHSYRDKLLTASEFNFLFIERDPANLAALEAELSQLKPFPPRVNVETSDGDAFERLSAILDELRRDRAQLTPAFLFVDPYGFKIPARLLGDLMKAGRVELFINVMWRPVPRRQSTGSYGEFDAQPARELVRFLDAVFTLVPAFRPERLTPRGEPRQ